MHQRKHLSRTIESLQSAYQTRLRGTGGVGFVRKLSSVPNPTVKQCQWIWGEPTRHQIRTAPNGADAFKCLAAVKEGSSYCECHHARCYVAPTPKDTSEDLA